MSATTLLILERGHRGWLETQFSDELYFAAALYRQGGGLDIHLRGTAAGYAIDTGVVATSGIAPSVRPADPRRSLRALLAAGARVWVDATDLRMFGDSAARRLIPGVRPVADGEGPDWPDYERVWFF
ncbi:hypothetical protein ACWEKT_24700 [Nocardia takedensis]